MPDALSQPQSPAPWYPPPQPEKKGLSTGAIVASVVSVVVVVIVVGAVIAGAFLTGIQQASNLSEPNVAITNYHGSYTEDCGAYGTNTTACDLTATLANTGGGGFVDIGFKVNGQQARSNTYHINAHSDLPIDESFSLDGCYGSTSPTYAIVVLSERSA